MFLQKKKLVKYFSSSSTRIFLPFISRKCARAPRIVYEEEALKLNKNNFQTIRFPIHLEGNLEPKIYACDHHKEHPYPGLNQ